MKLTYLISIVLLVFSISLISAQQEDIRFYHEIDTNLTIFEKCRIDGGICDATYTCSLTVLSPSQELIIDNQTMAGEGTYRTFTLNTTQTEVNGLYESTVDCTNSTNSGSDTFFYEITPNGSPPIDEGQGLILFGSIILLIIIASFFGLLGFKSKSVTVMLSFLSFSVLIMVFTLGFIVNTIELSFGTFSEIIGSSSSIYLLFTILLSVGALGLILYLVVVALNYYWGLRGMTDTVSVQT